MFSVSDRRFTDNTNRVVNAPTVRIQEPPKTNGVNPAELSDALSSGKSKKKAYRRWDHDDDNNNDDDDDNNNNDDDDDDDDDD